MKKTSNPIVFFGTDKFSLVTLKLLVDCGFDVHAVVTKPDAPSGRGHHYSSPEVKKFAESKSIPVLQPRNLVEIKGYIESLDHPAGVLVSYGKIIPQSIIDLFYPGIINVHPSILPKYRGPSPIEYTILKQEKEAGISIMHLDSKMDAGPIYQQKSISLLGNETSEQLYERLGIEGAQLLIDVLPAILDGTLKPKNQQESIATYCEKITKSDGIINWNEPADVIEAKIRALHMWPQSRTALNELDVIITRAEVLWNYVGKPGDFTLRNNTELIIGAKAGGLRILSLKPIGKKEMPIEAFLSGYNSYLLH